MCGIIGIARRRSARQLPDAAELTGPMASAIERLGADEPEVERLAEAAEALEKADRLVRGPIGVVLLRDDARLRAEVVADLDIMDERIDVIEAALESRVSEGPTRIEELNAAIVRTRDALWALRHDRLRSAVAVTELVGADVGWAAVEAFCSIQQALSSLDRLEVRGRDSAGISVTISGHGIAPDDADFAALVAGRTADPLFRSGAVRRCGEQLVFVYKAAAEIGELGDNTRHLRSAIAADSALRRALASDDARAIVLGHTRWASVGIISEANAHPLDSAETSDTVGPLVVAALNGDVDNFADLKAASSLAIAGEITTDAKVIPTLVSRRLADGAALDDAFRATVAGFEGSVAIGAVAADRPDTMLLALRGSGQALYVGLTDDAFVVASEPYGLIEETDRYVRMDGETPADPDNPTASRGQVLVLDADLAGSLDGISRSSYDGVALPVVDDDVTSAEITTRDIDRGAYPHFLLKEITEAPTSFRKTLRGKIIEDEHGLRVRLGPSTLSDDVRQRLRSGVFGRVIVIGQGTAHIAGHGLAAALTEQLGDTNLRIDADTATELSAFKLRPDMSDSLVIAISQSGTTTDTNRTVDLVRDRGATVIAIVNRRNSDLTDKADGVLYTSDGRDVEMAVPSTKAFYSQIAAGTLLALAIADELGAPADQELLAALRELPGALEACIDLRPEIAAAAQQFTPSRRYWAVVGSGTDRIAAEEVRIKLSELCYKSIACDATEDKKHIDLSAEPLILVCAAGLTGSNADDVAKEVAIYRAHKAAPIVIAMQGESTFDGALAVIGVPRTHPRLAFILSAMVGHLFGYEAALAVDSLAQPLREARAAIETAVSAGVDGGDMFTVLHEPFEIVSRQFYDWLRNGSYDGSLEASTAVRIGNLLRYSSSSIPLDSYQLDHGKVGTPSVVVEDLTAALTQGIDELTRPIDAIKHQAKTVTVGISRSDESLLQVPLVAETLAAGAPRDRLSYKTLRTLANLSPAVTEVTGYTRYRIESWDGDDAAIVVTDRGGISLDLPLRTSSNPTLRGTKHRVAIEREVFVARGRSDGRPIIIVPEVKDGQTTGLTLLHIHFADVLPAATARAVLRGYRDRFSALKDSVTETEASFREDLLGTVPIGDLLTMPVTVVAEQWRTGSD